MSLSRLAFDAEEMARKLKARELAVDCITRKFRRQRLSMRTLKEYKECVEKLQAVTPSRSRAALVDSLLQETALMKHLETENRQLQQLVDEQDAVLKLILSRYADQVQTLGRLNALEASLSSSRTNDDLQFVGESKAISRLSDFIEKFSQVCNEVAESDAKLLEEKARLHTENATLAELLRPLP